MKIKISYLFKIFTIAAILVLFATSLSAQKALNKARDSFGEGSTFVETIITGCSLYE